MSGFLTEEPSPCQIMMLDDMKRLIREKKIKWTTHCLEKMAERDISIADVKHAMLDGEIIEDYPDDFPHPSCLVYGKTLHNQPIHVVAGSNGENVYMITAYFPNTIKFEADLKTRRK